MRGFQILYALPTSRTVAAKCLTSWIEAVSMLSSKSSFYIKFLFPNQTGLDGPGVASGFIHCFCGVVNGFNLTSGSTPSSRRVKKGLARLPHNFKQHSSDHQPNHRSAQGIAQGYPHGPLSQNRQAHQAVGHGVLTISHQGSTINFTPNPHPKQGHHLITHKPKYRRQRPGLRDDAAVEDGKNARWTRRR